MHTVILATTNKNKLNRIQALFDPHELEVVSLASLGYVIPEPEEYGLDGLENAVIKSRYYFRNLQVKSPALAQDDTLFLEGVSAEDSPGKDIKLPVIKRYGEFTDERAYAYYQELLNKYGGAVNFEFRYGFALTPSENETFAERARVQGKLTSTISEKRTPGYFLADMMLVTMNGVEKYYNELIKEELVQIDQDIKGAIMRLLGKL